ncbi:MAG: N-acetylmuramoyl-L-alanine amidase [Parachlamydia sp.]|nr:N-acetylmuramoyl-L-alanine amidase [Parachlamydia sp.]
MKIFFFLLLLTSCGAPVYREVTPLPAPTFPQTPPAPPPIASQEIAYQEKATVTIPLNNRKVVLIDAGHGGEDFGARSLSTPRYQEKNLTLSTAKLLKTYLEQKGYAAIMTRSEDVFVPLDKRAKIANQLRPELFVSVHFNSAPSREAAGIEVYFYRSKEDQTRSKSSRLLAQAVMQKLGESTGAKSRGVKHGNFLVIRETEVPAILVEGGFLTNNDEMERIKDPAYLKKLAWGIAEGVQAYLK